MKFTPGFYFPLACIVIVGIILDSVWRWIRNIKISSLMKSRMYTEDRFETFFSEIHNPAIAKEVRVSFEKLLSIKLQRLFPSDRFDHELDMDPKGDKGMLKFITDLEGKYDIDLPYSAECMKMTVGDFVKMIDEKVYCQDKEG